MEGCDILLFGTMADIGPTVRDDLSGRGLDVVLVDFPQNTPRDFFGYRRGLLKAVETLRPKAVLPIGDALAMARVAEEPAAGAASQAARATFVVADAEAVALLGSKVRCYALAESLGLRQPRRFTFEEVLDRIRDEGDTEREDIGVIFKRDISFGGSGVHRPRSISALKHLIEHENGTPYLIEEYIPGEDLSTDCIRTENYFRAESYISTGRDYTQGPSVGRIKTDCPEAAATARRILDALGYRGVCGFDFRRTPDGLLYLLECNPRFTGGLKTQIESGFDIPHILLAQAQGE